MVFRTVLFLLPLLADALFPEMAFAQPAIYYRGIRNAASLSPAALPSGAIARGSIFRISGSGIGPVTAVTATNFPLETNLTGVTVRITSGTTQLDAIPISVSAGSIDAIMPSKAPLGMASVRVTYNNLAATLAPVRIVEVSPGLFSAADSGSGPGVIANLSDEVDPVVNTTAVPAMPGQVVSIQAAGLGAIDQPDSAAPPTNGLVTALEVTVGGMVAEVLYRGRAECCAGRDEIRVRLPDAVPLGCWVPVLVRAGGVTSNAVTMAVSVDGSACTEGNAISDAFLAGGNIGILRLFRNSTLQDVGVKAPVEVANDFFRFQFAQTTGGENSFSPEFSLPPAGSCTVFLAEGDLLDGGGIAAVPSVKKKLTAGTTILVTGPRGLRSLNVSDPSVQTARLGTYAPFLGNLPNQLTLDTGDYTIASNGGADVGAFSALAKMPVAFTWTGRNNVRLLDRTKPLTLTWTGAPDGQLMQIYGVTVDLPGNASAAFRCMAPADSGTFTVPAAVMSVLPATQRNLRKTKAVIYLMPSSVSNGVPFDAAGLDAAATLTYHMIGKTVVIQ